MGEFDSWDNDDTFGIEFNDEYHIDSGGNNKRRRGAIVFSLALMVACALVMINRSSLATVEPIPGTNETENASPSSPTIPFDQSVADTNIPDYKKMQQYFLTLVNQARVDGGLRPVAWDDLAAQVGQAHASEMVSSLYMSHWNLLGYGPDIRYSLAGGTENVQENVFSYWQRYSSGEAVPIENWETIIEKAHESLMDSPGHRRNIMNPDHTQVGIGLAYDPETGEFRAAQEFINRYIAMDDLPQEAIPLEEISISGQLYPGSSEPLINIAFEPYPYELTVDALNKTSTYQSPANFLEAFSVSPDLDGRFETKFELGSQPGLYHIYIWVNYANENPLAIDSVIWVPRAPN
jgi:uncharacterized protein YkwD